MKKAVLALCVILTMLLLQGCGPEKESQPAAPVQQPAEAPAETAASEPESPEESSVPGADSALVRSDASRNGFSTAQSLAEETGVSLTDGAPLYQPERPQPMNAYLVTHEACQLASSKEGICNVAETGLYADGSDLTKYMHEWIDTVAAESGDAIRFVKDPQEADLLIAANLQYPFYDTYSLGKLSAEGYACSVTLTAWQLTCPEHTASLTGIRNPDKSERISSGTTRFWKKPPDFTDTKELTGFVSSILGWYGFGVRPGDEGEAVSVVRQALANRGFLKDAAGTACDPETEEAIRALQQACGLRETGLIDGRTLPALWYDAATVANTPGMPMQYALQPSDGAADARTYAQAGDIVRFGRYPQDNDPETGPEEIQWKVLEREGDRILLLSRFGLDCSPFHEGEDAAVWDSCTLRAWLNADFLDAAFTEEEKAGIPEIGIAAEQSPDPEAPAGQDTKDRVFLPSYAEMEQAFGSYEDMQCWATDYAKQQGVVASGGIHCSWWLRSPGKKAGEALYISSGSWEPQSYSAAQKTFAVRPALWADLSVLAR